MPSAAEVEPEELASTHRAVRAGSAFVGRAAIAEIEGALSRFRRRLSAIAPDDPSERTAAEWTLDNDYLIRRALGQLRREFPPGFQARLPRLEDGGRPRVLVVAEIILERAPPEIDLDAIEGFLTAYQTQTTLTLAELWALPVLMRLVVLRDLSTVLDGLFETSRRDGRDPGMAAGRAIRALRLLAEIDLKALFCRQSATERQLAEDPAGAYEQMDFDTRDSYRRAVEQIAAAGAIGELEVARAAIELARHAPPDGRQDHVGQWLIGRGRDELERSLGVRTRSIAERLRAAPNAWFFGLMTTAQLAMLAPVLAYLDWLDAAWPYWVLALVVAWVPATVPATTLVHWLLAALLPPRLLPKLDFSEGIPERWRTLVVVPSLLGDDEAIDHLVEQLEIHYLANPDPELRFALLTDHEDTHEPPGALHDARRERAARAIRRLNARHGGAARRPFHLLHRESRWNGAEARWMGWERKRGKLEELNRYLRGDTQTSYELHEGDRAALEDVAFVLTLDSDTQLPPGAAARLVGALAHPLNRPERDHRGRTRAGYTVIQPRVEIAPRSARRSPFTTLFAGDTGIDIYTRAVSELYQDLFGEGIFVGKGIYDLEAFAGAVGERVPENALVSHDLFEGIHGRAALATDIVVYEDYPPHYAAHLSRLHRWVRGDWQLLPWLGARVPTPRGPVPNRLGLLDRFKIVDNLRRSLFAPSILALLVCGWFVLPGHPLAWTLAALLAPGAAAASSLLGNVSLPRRELGRWFLAVCFAAPETWVAFDAIGRVLIRMFVTKKRMLQWTTAAHEARRSAGRGAYLRRLWAGPLVSLGLGGALAASSPTTLVWASPVLLLWLAVPEIAYRISRPTPPRVRPVDEASRRYLRRVARRTWLFFETFVGPTDQWLPPDHYQEHPRPGPAHRTSPTNIGLLLLSELTAYDLGYLGVDELVSWVANTLSSVERLERHRGHIFNWYDSRTLVPLEPRYVSTVDSGNLAGALIALAVGLERAASDPPVRPAIREGLLDAAELLREVIDEWSEASQGPAPEAARIECHALVETLRYEDPTRPMRDLLATAQRHVDGLEARLLEGLAEGDSVSHDPALLRELRIWIERLEHQLHEAHELIENLTPGPLAGEAIPLAEIPRAGERARGKLDDPEEIERVAEAERRATVLRARLVELAGRARALADGMELRFLYDPVRRLFHVGYDVGADRLDPHHYDLLASEARLASFLAVVRREVPVEHWFTLGRTFGHTDHTERALLSWGGSMFEYLMPPLLMHSHPDTLLARSCEAAIDRQIAYGHEQGTPWGISESGYAHLDGQQSYQYRAFGVPGLGLRRGLDEDVVIAPYASLLALPFRPREVADNLRALERIGMRGRYGFYEAADFHRERAPTGSPARVRSYMAHHHGMSLVALDNYFCDDVMVERFHAEPLVKSGALLLDERVPEAVVIERPKPEAMAPTDVALTPTPPIQGWEPDRATMQLWALGNGSLTTFIGADGGGGVRFHDVALTRWRPDPATEQCGCFIYLIDLDAERAEDRLLSVTPAPLGSWPADGRVRFEAGFVEFHARHGTLSVRLRVAVASAADVEVRELEISNEGDRPRCLRVIACVEPVLEDERGAFRHPAFSKLFLRCEPIPELGGFLATRAVREGPPAPVLLYRMVGDRGMEPRPLEIDRGAFLGRWGSFAAPAALGWHDGHEPAAGTIDPICACGADVDLDPGTGRMLALVTGAARSRSEALGLARRFGSTHAVRWAFEDAAHAAARRVTSLGIPPSLLPHIQRLLGALLAPEARLRAEPSVLDAGRPGQPALWARGISGDEPLLAVRGRALHESAPFAELLAVHRYLRALGVSVDLVLLEEEAGGYLDADAEALRRALASAGAQHLLHQRAGVHLVRVDQLSPQELMDLEAAAQVFLRSSAGGLAAQLAELPERAVELPPFEPAGPPPGAPRDPEVELEPTGALELDNGLGGFDGDEYVIRPGARTPAPWCNVLANAELGCLVSEAGMGSTWSLNAGENRLTPWRNDPVTDLPSEVLYLRDEESARVWSTTPRPMGVPTRVRHGAGYTTYELACEGLTQTMTVFVPPGASAKVVRLRVHNQGIRARRLTATYYAEWVLGARREETRSHVRSELLAEEACVLARNSWSIDFADRVAFLAADHPLHGATCDRVELLGRGGDLARPAALGRWGLSGRAAPGLDPCAALQVHLDLTPGETVEACFFLGQAEGRAEALAAIEALRAPGAVEAAFEACQAGWDALLEAVRVHTPDPTMDRLLNRWLLYQSLASRFLGRTAFYQSSGAYGFRDQLQDSLAYLHCAPAMTRAHLLEAAAHQFEEGDVQHWWHPPGGAGVRTRCSDDLLWLVYVTADYVEATGDLAVLDEEAPFLQAEPLEATEVARYGRFPAGAPASLLEHCRRGVERGFTAGPHGLPLIGDGDWNDGMNRVGDKGRGESVWLGWFLHVCTRRLADLLDRVGERAEAERWRDRLGPLAEALEEHGWDGGWYRRAYHDEGIPLGSAHAAPPHIDSIAQSWAAISGVGDPGRVSEALEAADRLLVNAPDRLVLLLAPPFGRRGPDAGYIGAYPAGVRENGGQYTHAAAWLGWAHAVCGDGAGAQRIFRLLNPLLRTEDEAQVARYRVEPYVIAADVYGRAPFVGRGGWTWYTGAAAWVWRLGVEAILGLRREDGALLVEPCIPPEWDGFEAWVREGELRVHVVVDNAARSGVGVVAARLDGQPIERARVELSGSGERLLEVRLGPTAASPTGLRGERASGPA